MPRAVKSLVFCVHAHQPVGNFDGVFLEAYEKCYRPFFEVLEKHPSLPVVCHLSGSLIDWLEVRKPEFLQKMKRMHAAGQIEFLGGGYYEPIYGAIPKRDLAGQIGMMRQKLQELFGPSPQGVWLTERVWDPRLVGPLRASSVEYTILDDLHLERAGVASPVTGYYQAREGKRSLDLFASLQELRYLLPFRKPEQGMDFIRSLKGGPEEVLVFADDCEKFGLWPGTHDWVYKEGWLERFFRLLEKEKTIRVYTFGQFRRHYPPKGVVRIPHSSYSEMMEWSGGRFYNFFKKYPESRYMRDRMWSVSDSIHRVSSRNGRWNVREAKEALYKAQCNCTYWHGVFGGLYLHHLRSAVFENLIRADAMLDKAEHAGRKGPLTLSTEKLKSGRRWKLKQRDLVSFFNPAYGGALEELDFIPKAVNLMCNLQRHRETYHEAVLKKVSTASEGVASIHQILGSKEKDLEKHLYYDPVRRLSLLDHIFEAPIGLEDFSRSLYAEAGDFVGRPYTAAPLGKARSLASSLSLERNGHVRLGRARHALKLTKVVSPAPARRGGGQAGLNVRYELRNKSRAEMRFVLGVEFNFSIGENEASKGLSVERVRDWVLRDSWRGISIRLEADPEVGFLAAPVETVSESEGGLERTYQELGVLLQRPFELRPGGAAGLTLKISIG